MGNTNVNSRMRIYHRYLGYFLAGIMAVYAISGFVMIFRDSGFLKFEKQIERSLRPQLTAGDLGRELRIRDLKVNKEEGNVVYFEQGTYNKSTGMAGYTSELNREIDPAIFVMPKK